MTPEQSTQVAQLAFLAVIIVPCFVVIAVGIFVSVRVLPVMLRQAQQLIDNNSKLTKIAEQNANQFKSNEITLAGIIPELKKQTEVIQSGNNEIRNQSLDFRNYQTLVSDNMSAHAQQLDVNNAKLDANTEVLRRFEATINALPEVLRALIEDKIKCAGIEQSIQALRYEVQQVIAQQAKRSTGTIPVIGSSKDGTT